MSNQMTILSALEQSIQEVIPTIPTECILPDKSLKDLGANSIDRAEIIMLTLRALDLKLPLSIFARAKNIGELLITMEQSLVSSGTV